MGKQQRRAAIPIPKSGEYPCRNFMDEQKVWIYVGKGEFIDGIPARDLIESDMARLDVDAQATVENSKLYRRAPRKAEPAAVEEAPKRLKEESAGDKNAKSGREQKE